MSDDVGGITNILLLLRQKKSLWLIAAALVIGIFLMLLGGSADDSSAAKEGDGVLCTDTSALEAKVTALCERVYGVSEVSVMITLDADSEAVPRVLGVVVVCRGGDDAATRLKLTELLCALFSVPSSSVSVAGGK